MSFYSNFGYLPPSPETGEVWKTTNDIPPQWDAQTLQVRNMGAPTQPNDSTTKSYVDSQSINSILTTDGDIAVFSDNAADPKVVRFPVGTDDQVIVADSALDEGIKYTNDLLGLNDVVMTGELMVDSIVKNVGSALALEDSVLINTTGATTIVQIGDPTPPSNTNDVELNLIGKKDCAIFLKADSDGSGSMDSAFICTTIRANTVFAGISLNKPTNEIQFQSADDGTQAPPDMLFQVNGSYTPTALKPSPSSFNVAMRIKGDTANVEIPNELDVETIINTQQTRDKSTVGLAIATAGDTATLTASQIFGGLVIGQGLTANAIYTMPSAASIVAAITNPIVDSFYKFIVLNNDGGGFEIQLMKGTGMTILSAENLGGDFRDLLQTQSVMCHIIIKNITSTFEAVDLFVLGPQ